MQFKGYRRGNGKVGIRNYVGVISTVVCANEVTNKIASNTRGAIAFTHNQGCCQTTIDIERVKKTLSGIGNNPNLFSILLVGLGCESVSINDVSKAIMENGKKVEIVIIQECGGAAEAVSKGCLAAQQMVLEASRSKMEDCDSSDLVLGLKCGSSDTTSGLVPNPALGIASDLIVKLGGTSILGEVTEFIGAEHLLCKQVRNKKIGKKILEVVKKMENRAKAVGYDMRGGQPTAGNIKGGLTTIEEKSLGAITKAGNSPVQAVYEYGIPPKVKGLVVMDSPGREPEILTGLASAGCNIIAFTTGRGAPQGFPFVPVIKITANQKTAKRLSDHIDMDLSTVFRGQETIIEAGNRIFNEIIEVASGKLTKAEISGYYNSMDIYVVGPVI
jgi:altronate dehydratase large subunit